MEMMNRNCCDGIYNSFDVHFTSACDNKCKHCIDQKYDGLGVSKPDVLSILNSIIENQDGYDDVLFLGGEPCLYLDELIDCIQVLKNETSLKIYVTTSVPKICYDRRDDFIKLLELVDGINLSVQHHKEEIADIIRCTESQYDRQKFYANLPYKDKIRINLNLVKPYLSEWVDILACLTYYDKMGFNSIKISEIQHGEEHFVSFEKVFNLKMGSPYYSGCQTYLDMNKITQKFKTPVLLKRSCFLCEDTLKASFMDGVKVLYKTFVEKTVSNKYCVVYGDGTIESGWI